jgi:predicted dehydrogenase
MERSSLYPTDYNWRVLESEGGKLRAVADIGTHWLDLVQTITGLKVAAVCADLRTVFPTRQRPQGEVETFDALGLTVDRRAQKWASSRDRRGAKCALV